MKLAAQVKLIPTKEQHLLLREMLERCNAACNYISEIAWEQKIFGHFDLCSLLYHDVRKKFGINAEPTVRCIKKVSNAYKLDRKKRRKFQKHGGIPYNSRGLTWRTQKQFVSILTLEGRQKMPYECGPRQKALLETQQGESDLVFREGNFYLFACCEVEEPESGDFDEFLGVDLGIKNIAVDSDGTTFSGSAMNGVRKRHRRFKRKLQRKGTKPARRKLKKRRGKESRFAADVNHCISKKIVAKAQDTKRGIALEELKGIRSRITVRKSQRATHHSWSFFQLRTFVDYKAKLAGVPVVFVDPRNTSRTCPSCGFISKKNRKTQEFFSCVQCNFSGLADHIAACNIASRAAADQPIVTASS